jgi:hypothetical protein
MFRIGKETDLLGVSRGALAPPLGRFLSARAQPLYFLIAALCPALVSQVAYVLRKR